MSGEGGYLNFIKLIFDLVLGNIKFLTEGYYINYIPYHLEEELMSADDAEYIFCEEKFTEDVMGQK